MGQDRRERQPGLEPLNRKRVEDLLQADRLVLDDLIAQSLNPVGLREPGRRIVRVADQPGRDPVQLLHSIGVACVYEEAPGCFVRLEP